MPFLKCVLVFADIFIFVHVALSPDLASVRPPLFSSRPMASKRAGSKDIDGSATGAEIERVSTSLPIYDDTKLFLDKDIKVKGKKSMMHL